MVEVRRFNRGDEWEAGGGCGTASCEGTSYVVLAVSSTDDVSAVEEIGYRVGGLPSLSTRGGQLMRADASGELLLLLDGDDDGSEDLSFDLTVTAVDRAGNVSEETHALARNDGDGCNIAGGSFDSALWIALALAAMSWRGRRSRA